MFLSSGDHSGNTQIADGKPEYGFVVRIDFTSVLLSMIPISLLSYALPPVCKE